MAWIINPKNDIEDLKNDKVDKVEGKGLSTNDYTNTEKDKLSNIQENANNYSHPVNHDPSIITQDANNRFVTDAEKSTWNGKANVLNLTSTITTTWTGSEAPYTQVISIEGILESDKPSIDVDLSEVLTYSDMLDLLDEWAQVYRITTENGQITVYSQSITNLTIPINIKVVR
jgi:hypothetical protein